MPSRHLFGSLLVLLLAPQLGWAGAQEVATYRAEVRGLFGLIRADFDGAIEFHVDRPAGQYRLLAHGRGAGVVQHFESLGRILDGRFVPTRTTSSFRLGRRSSQTDLRYDYDGALVHYDHVGHTRFLARRWTARGTVPLPPNSPVDDVVTTLLNHVGRGLERTEAGGYRALVVARQRGAEPFRLGLVPIVFTVAPPTAGESQVALLDLTPLSGWARTRRPARITFGPDRVPRSVEAALRFGTRVRASLTWRAPFPVLAPASPGAGSICLDAPPGGAIGPAPGSACGRVPRDEAGSSG